MRRGSATVVLAMLLGTIGAVCRGAGPGPAARQPIFRGGYRLRGDVVHVAVRRPVTARTARRSAASTCAAARSATPSSIRISSAHHDRHPRHGMPAFKLDTAEMAGIIAYLRNMNVFDTAVGEDGRCRPRPRHLRRQGRAAPSVTASAPQGSRVGPESERHRRGSQRRLAAAVADRPDQPDDADQPAGPRRDQGRHGHQRPAAQRRHLHACSSSTSRSGSSRW